MSTELSDIGKASAKGSFFLFLGNSGSTITLALASVLIARFLGPEKYGLYTLAIIVPSFLFALSDIGISPALTRFSARLHYEGKDQKVVSLIRTGIISKSLFSLFLSIVLILFSQNIAIWILKRPTLHLLIPFTSLYLVGQALFMTLNSIFTGLNKMENSALLMNIQAITRLAASILLIILGMGAIGAILGIGLGYLLAVGIGVTILTLRIYPNLNNHRHEDNAGFFRGMKLLVPYGLPVYLSIIIFSFLTMYQGLVLAQFVSNIEIANYTIALNFSALVTLLSYPISTSLFPAFSKLSIKNKRNMVHNMFKLSVKYTSLLVIPASLAVVVLSDEIVYTLYGLQYQLAPSYLALYTLSCLYAGLGNLVISNFFNGQGDTKTSFRINLLSLAFSLPLVPILTLLYGVPGIIASVLISQLLAAIYGLFLAHRKYEVNIDYISSISIGVAAFSSALPTYLLLALIPSSNSVYNLAIGGLLYIILFLIFVALIGAVKISDIVNLRKLFSELGPFIPLFDVPLKFVEKILILRARILRNI